MSGYVKLYRSTFKNALFKREKYCRGFAWNWMVSKAMFADAKYDVRGKTIDVERGQFVASPDEMAEAWNWSRSAVNRFLTRLKSEHMIEQSTGHKKTIITICNYDDYQGTELEAGHITGHTTGHKPDTNRTVKEEDKENKEDIDKDSLAKIQDQSSQAISIFNQIAEKVGWSQVQKLSPARKKALTARIKDVGGLENWQAAIERASRSNLLSGKSTEWIANFDWLCKAANFTKLMEGNYDNRNGAQSPTSGSGLVGAAMRSRVEHSDGLPIHSQRPEEDDYGMLALGDGRF